MIVYWNRNFSDTGKLEDDTVVTIAKPQPEPVIVLCRTRLLRMDACSFVAGVENLSLKKKRADNQFTAEEVIDQITAEDKEDNQESGQNMTQRKGQSCIKPVLSSVQTNKIVKNKSRQDKKLSDNPEYSKNVDKSDLEIMMSYAKPAKNSEETFSLWSAMSSNQW